MIGRMLPLSVLVCVASACANGNDNSSVRITIPRGATLSAVADTLYAQRVVRAPRLFQMYARATGKERDIQAGTYLFMHGMTMQAALHKLVSGAETLERLTIPEGLMLTELAEQVYLQQGIPTDSFLSAASDSALRARAGVEAETLEGYLFPSTYYVRVGATAREIVAQMLDQFEDEWQPSWNALLTQLGWTRHDAVIFASIVEGEVRYRPDGPLVSSVYHNRLARGMRLQADPTVIYALGRRRRLFEKDYQFSSPYNTYLIDGLPPGPIGQPSAASLEAALFPAKTDFLYFVARPDGKHVFSRTLREHGAAIREIRN